MSTQEQANKLNANRQAGYVFVGKSGRLVVEYSSLGEYYYVNADGRIEGRAPFSEAA